MPAAIISGLLTSTSTAGEQVIVTHTVSGANLNMKLLTLGAAYSAYNATEAYIGFGRFQFNTGAGWETKDRSPAFVNTDLDNNNPLIIRPLGSGQVLAIGNGIRAIANPATSTSIRWTATIWGET